MNELFDLAAKLGQALRADARLLALEEAKRAYAADATLQASLAEYDVQQTALQQEIAKGDGRDLHLVDAIQHRVDELYRVICENEAFVKLNRAQEEVNALMSRVNAVITREITGEEPDASCTHDCRTCKGCH